MYSGKFGIELERQVELQVELHIEYYKRISRLAHKSVRKLYIKLVI